MDDSTITQEIKQDVKEMRRDITLLLVKHEGLSVRTGILGVLAGILGGFSAFFLSFRW